MRTKKLLKTISKFLLIPLIFGILFYWILEIYLLKAIDVNNFEPIYVLNQEGENFSQIADKIAEKGLIRHSLVLRIIKKYRSFYHLNEEVLTGEYKFSKWMTPVEIYKILTSGRTVNRSIKIESGMLLSEFMLFLSEGDYEQYKIFLKTSYDNKFIKSLGVNAPSLEGYIGPGIVNFSRTDSIKNILRKMYKNHEEFWSSNFDFSEEKTGLNKNQIMTIASIMIKERVLEQNKKAFLLKIKDKLEKKETLNLKSPLMYGLRMLGGNLTEQLKKFDIPFNTYINKGLPPGPICVPSKDSIDSVVKYFE